MKIARLVGTLDLIKDKDLRKKEMVRCMNDVDNKVRFDCLSDQDCNQLGI